jgi:acyl carrier protein
MFRLEREFMIKIRQDELFSEPLLRGGAQIVDDGQVTDEGLALLRARLPYADLKELERGRRLNQIDDLFTVDLLSRFISWKLGGSGEASEQLDAPVLVSQVLIHQ